MSGTRHFWRFLVRASGPFNGDREEARDRGWGWTRERAAADVRRKYAKRGQLVVELLALERVCPPGRHTHRDAAGQVVAQVDGGDIVAAELLEAAS